MPKLKVNILLLTFSLTITGLSISDISDVRAQTDYEEYLKVETNTAQELKQKNVGSGESTNINCGANIAGTNLAQTITCPAVPGQSPTPNEPFNTATFSRTIRLEPGSPRIETAEVSCPQGTEVTGGGYELREMNADTHTLMDAPNDNGWKVSIKTDVINEDGFLTVYAICGALGEIPVEICNDGIDNDGDMLVDTADPDCAEPPPPRDTNSDGVRDTTDNCDNVPNPGQEDTDSDGIGDACDETPFPIEVCTNFTDDDGDGLADIDDPDCEGVEWFRFELSNCQIFDAPMIIACDAEQTDPLPPTYDSLSCRVSAGGVERCSLGRIGGGSDNTLCQYNNIDSPETAVCFVEPDD